MSLLWPRLRLAWCWSTSTDNDTCSLILIVEADTGSWWTTTNAQPSVSARQRNICCYISLPVDCSIAPTKQSSTVYCTPPRLTMPLSAGWSGQIWLAGMRKRSHQWSSRFLLSHHFSTYRTFASSCQVWWQGRWWSVCDCCWCNQVARCHVVLLLESSLGRLLIIPLLRSVIR